MNDCIAKPVNAAELLHKVWGWGLARMAGDLEAPAAA